MLTARRRYDTTQKYYFDSLYETYGQIPENHLEAIYSRQNFFRDWVLERETTDYTSDVEKDWSYIARREYRWIVTSRALADAYALASCACILRTFMLKKFICWPFAPVFLVTYIYRQNHLFFFHNKKLFDMLNVGEQYEMGRERNIVLRKCNQLLDREDF